MQNKYQDQIDNLIKYNQQDLLEKIKNFSEEDKDAIFEELSNINLEELMFLYNNKDKKENKEVNIEPIEAIDKEKIPSEELKKLENIGEDVIKKGGLAVVTMAGGQRYKTWT